MGRWWVGTLEPLPAIALQLVPERTRARDLLATFLAASMEQHVGTLELEPREVAQVRPWDHMGFPIRSTRSLDVEGPRLF